jgi:hypothetical protein
MMKVLLVQLDGKIPNIALMKCSAHYRAKGFDVQLQTITSREKTYSPPAGVPPETPVIASMIFKKTRPIGEGLKAAFPQAVIGGSGWDTKAKLSDVGVTTLEQDYSIYPGWTQSIGFSQRGCRLKCPFCEVPTMEGKFQKIQGAVSLWRGDPWPRHLVLLDNDFFGDKNWAEEIEAIRSGKFKVNFHQGINARFLTDETAAAIGSVDYRDVNMRDRQIYTAWDNRKDQDRLFRGLELLKKHGVKPGHMTVYILCGYWPWSDRLDWEYRRKLLREFGARPYPMPFHRTRESVGFQRWVCGAYDKRVSWEDWIEAGYRPEKLKLYQTGKLLRPAP